MAAEEEREEGEHVDCDSECGETSIKTHGYLFPNILN